MRFPKEIVLKIEQDGRSSFLVACKDANDAAEHGSIIKVCVYRKVREEWIELSLSRRPATAKPKRKGKR